MSKIKTIQRATPKQITAAVADESEVYFTADLLFGVACAPATMPRAEVERRVRAENPSGTTAGWCLSGRRKLEDGSRIPAPCLDDPTRRHWLFEC